MSFELPKALRKLLRPNPYKEFTIKHRGYTYHGVPVFGVYQKVWVTVTCAAYPNIEAGAPTITVPVTRWNEGWSELIEIAYQ